MSILIIFDKTVCQLIHPKISWGYNMFKWTKYWLLISHYIGFQWDFQAFLSVFSKSRFSHDIVHKWTYFSINHWRRFLHFFRCYSWHVPVCNMNFFSWINCQKNPIWPPFSQKKSNFNKFFKYKAILLKVKENQAKQKFILHIRAYLWSNYIIDF